MTQETLADRIDVSPRLCSLERGLIYPPWSRVRAIARAHEHGFWAMGDTGLELVAGCSAEGRSLLFAEIRCSRLSWDLLGMEP